MVYNILIMEDFIGKILTKKKFSKIFFNVSKFIKSYLVELNNIKY